VLSSSLSRSARCSRGTLGQTSSCPRPCQPSGCTLPHRTGHCRALGSGLAHVHVRACASARFSFVPPPSVSFYSPSLNIGSSSHSFCYLCLPPHAPVPSLAPCSLSARCLPSILDPEKSGVYALPFWPIESATLNWCLDKSAVGRQGLLGSHTGLSHVAFPMPSLLARAISRPGRWGSSPDGGAPPWQQLCPPWAFMTCSVSKATVCGGRRLPKEEEEEDSVVNFSWADMAPLSSPTVKGCKGPHPQPLPRSSFANRALISSPTEAGIDGTGVLPAKE